MANVYLFMGQGVVANLRNHTLMSSQFCSCAPIILVNRYTYKAALYHYGGGRMTDSKQSDLRMLDTMVSPTDVYCLTGDGDMDFMGGDSSRKVYTRSHIAGIKALFQNQATVHVKAPNGQEIFSSVTVSYDRGGCRIEDDADTDSDTYRLNTQSAIASLPGDIKFVGERDEDKLSLWIAF